MEMDEEYLQTVFDTPLQTKEFIAIMGTMEKAAMDDKAKKSMEFALKLLDAHSDVPEIATIVDKIKAALGSGGSTYPAPGQPGYGSTPAAKDKEGGKTVEKKDLKKDEKGEEPGEKGKLVKSDDPVIQAQLDAFWKENEEKGKMLKAAQDKIGDLEKKEKMRGYMAKAAEFDALSQDGLADMLMDVGENSPGSYEKFVATLAASNEANKQNKVMGEIGTSDVPKDDVETKIEAGTRNLMKKDSGLSERAARLQFIGENPEVYESLEARRLKAAREA
jgi:hypothetical protein